MLRLVQRPARPWPLDAEFPHRAVAEVRGFLQDFLKGMRLVRKSHSCFLCTSNFDTI